MSDRPSPVQTQTPSAQLLLTAAREILLLVDGEGDGLQIMEANAAASALLGYPHGELIGMPVGDLECALSDLFFWDEMRARTEATVVSAYRCADGSVLDVSKRVIRLSEKPLRFGVSAAPAAQEQRVSVELANMGSRLRATLEATADGILLVDQHGAILNMNRRFSMLWGIPESLLANRDDVGIMAHMGSQIDAAKMRSHTPDNPAKGEDYAETQYLLDGRVIECTTHAARAGEELIGRVYSYRDVSERHRTQAELIAARDEARRASQAKGDFLAMMSHEIRTPMNGVLGIAQLLAGTQLNAEQADYLRIIRSSGETLLAILNDILDYSKIEAGKLELERIEFALLPVLDDVNALFRTRLREGGPTFRCVAAADVPPRLLGDPVRLRQILFNLVGNAFKFTERGGIEVTVALDRTGAAAAPGGVVALRFAVRDTGIGIAADRQAGVFDAFEQADAATNRRFGGTGLGLSICRRLVHLMGGEIGLSSTVGEGSEFWFTAQLGIPAVQLAPVAHVARGISTPPAAVTQVLTAATRILLAEDNPINCVVMMGMLKRLGGAAPVVAGNGQEALSRLALETFDLILMDVQMPVMDGLEATRRIRALGLTLPIIGISAGAMEEEQHAARESGMTDYVLKPVAIEALATALTRALAAPLAAG